MYQKLNLLVCKISAFYLEIPGGDYFLITTIVKKEKQQSSFNYIINDIRQTYPL